MLRSPSVREVTAVFVVEPEILLDFRQSTREAQPLDVRQEREQAARREDLVTHVRRPLQRHRLNGERRVRRGAHGETAGRDKGGQGKIDN